MNIILLKMRKLLLIVVVISFFSCSKQEDYSIDGRQANGLTQIELKQNEKNAFASALAKALEKNENLRAFIKAEALKMFDNDYDVLYHLVKNEKIDGNKTFRTLLLREFKDEEDLKVIENKYPLLTIFVPTLPSDSFSAESWDIINEIPSVAYVKQNMVNIVDGDDNILVLKKTQIPGFPVVVIKNNERVVTESNMEKGSNTQSKSKNLLSKNGMNYGFLDDAFNGILKKENKKKDQVQERVTYSIDQRLRDAYNIYKEVDGWHRDFIYYGLTPSNTKGQFNYDFQENITYFKLNGNPESVYKKLSDQREDPLIIDEIRENETVPKFGGDNITEVHLTPESKTWTEGYYEFKVKSLINAKNGVGTEIVTYFSAQPYELFNLNYSRSVVLWSTPNSYYNTYMLIFELESIELKGKSLNIPIFNWDLNQYASSIKIEIEEVDLSETTTITDTRSVKFANNFSIDGGILKKIGLKYGSTLETNATHTIQKTFTQGNDQLGSVIINFADDVIIDKKNVLGLNRYVTRTYSTGWFQLSLEPKRVQ